MQLRSGDGAIQNCSETGQKWDSIQSNCPGCIGFLKNESVCDSKRKENKREWKSTRYKYPSQWVMELKLGLETKFQLRSSSFFWGCFCFCFFFLQIGPAHSVQQQRRLEKDEKKRDRKKRKSISLFFFTREDRNDIKRTPSHGHSGVKLSELQLFGPGCSPLELP